LDQEKSKTYSFLIIEILIELKSHKDCISHCKKLIESVQDDKDRARIYFLSAKVFLFNLKLKFKKKTGKTGNIRNLGWLFRSLKSYIINDDYRI